MELVHECTFHADTAAALVVGDGPAGTRMIVPVTGGWAKGERLNGTVTGPGADWIVVGADGYGRLEVRTQLLTDDGALVYLTYIGILELNDAVQAAVADGASTEYDDQYFRSTPRFETGDSRYGWVNTTVFVGEGRIAPGGVEYEIYRLS